MTDTGGSVSTADPAGSSKTPGIALNGAPAGPDADNKAVQAVTEATSASEVDQESLSSSNFIRQKLSRSAGSYASVPPEGSILTGKQEHYLKRELLSQQAQYEIEELASPTALQRFGAPFRSSRGEVSPQESELPILRYMFVNHVRNFPFLDRAREKEFWQDKLQVFLESFANKHISTSEDRLEDTKRKKLAVKAQKLLEIMMVSGIPTASGYEERIRFSEMEVVERGAQEGGLVANAPKAGFVNGWEINVAAVRSKSVRKHMRWKEEAEYVIRVRKEGGLGGPSSGQKSEADEEEICVVRTYDDFKKMHKRIRMELPGKVLPPLPRYNSADQVVTINNEDAHYEAGGSDSESTVSSQNIAPAGQLQSPSSPVPVDSHLNSRSPDTAQAPVSSSPYSLGGLRGYLPFAGAGHRREHSASSQRTPRASVDMPHRTVLLYRETSRVSLRAALRGLLQNDRIASSTAMMEFLTADPIKQLTPEEIADIDRRHELDDKRIREQRRFYEVARQRAAELDVHMEKFRREIVEHSKYPCRLDFADDCQMDLRNCSKRSK
jgi:PX-associated